MYPLYPPLQNTSIEHIQGYLIAHQNLINTQRSSLGSMFVFEAFTSNYMDYNIQDTFIEEVIRGLKEWSDYDTESKDRENFAQKFIFQTLNDSDEFIKTVDKWLIDQIIFEDQSVKSSAKCLLELFNGLLGNEFEVHKLLVDVDYMYHSKECPRNMYFAWGMDFDLFILKNHQNKIILRFGDMVT